MTTKNETRTTDNNNAEVTKSDLNYLEFCKKIGAFITRDGFDMALDEYAESGLSKQQFIEKYKQDYKAEFFDSGNLQFVMSDIYSEFEDRIDAENSDCEIDMLKLLCALSEKNFQLHDQLYYIQDKLIDTYTKLDKNYSGLLDEYSKLKDKVKDVLSVPNAVNYWSDLHQ